MFSHFNCDSNVTVINCSSAFGWPPEQERDAIHPSYSPVSSCPAIWPLFIVPSSMLLQINMESVLIHIRMCVQERRSYWKPHEVEMSYSDNSWREFSIPLWICAYEHGDESTVPSLNWGKPIHLFYQSFFKVTWFSEYTWDFYPLAFRCNKELSITGSREWSNCLSDISANCAQVQACGSLVTEEQPESMLVPIELFLMFYSFYKRPFSNSSPTSPLSPPCVPPELLSSEGLGLKLKPIKTRVAVQAWGRACLQIILSNLWVILCRRSLLFHDT